MSVRLVLAGYVSIFPCAAPADAPFAVSVLGEEDEARLAQALSAGCLMRAVDLSIEDDPVMCSAGALAMAEELRDHPFWAWRRDNLPME